MNIMVRNMQKCKNKSVLVSDNTTLSFIYRSLSKSPFAGVILMLLVQVHQAGASKQDGTEFLEIETTNSLFAHLFSYNILISIDTGLCFNFPQQ